MMNYLEWSTEYLNAAKGIDDTITKLRTQRKNATFSEKKELDATIYKYKTIFNECMQTARLLELRHKGVM